MRRASVLAAFAALVTAMAGCTQDDQVLSIDLADDEPVTRTAPAAGEMTISTPAGVSVTLPEGTVSPGARVTVAPVDLRQVPGASAAIGNKAYLLSFEEPPKKAPVVKFSNTLQGPTTASRILGAVPAVRRVSSVEMRPSHAVVVPIRSVAPLSDASFFGFFSGAFQQLQERLGSNWFASPSAPVTFPDVTGQFQGLLKQFRRISVHLFSPWNDLSFLQSLNFQQSIDEGFQSSSDQGCDEDPSACNFLIFTIEMVTTPLGEPVDLDEEAVLYPLIPEGRSSASFGLVCAGFDAGDEVETCGFENVDVRASQTLLDRYAGSGVAIKYIAAVATLHEDGTAEGLVEYDVALRVPMGAGITGYAMKDSLDITGTWSAVGNRLTIGGYTFTYATPDPDHVILAVDDSVKVKNNDGTERWEPVQAFLKLVRVDTH